jgi:DNA primase
MPLIDFAKVKELVPIEVVLQILDWRPTERSGDELRGKCPIHTSHSAKSRSFAVSTKGFFCHSCKKRGDSITLYAEARRLTLFKAAEELCKEAGFEVPYFAKRTYIL